MTTLENQKDSDSITKIRLTLDLSQKLNAVVEKIAAEKGTTKADVLRAAIEYLDMADDASKEGMKVGAWKKEDNVRTERIFGGI
jgi:predicted DNA-binding protein